MMYVMQSTGRGISDNMHPLVALESRLSLLSLGAKIMSPSSTHLSPQSHYPLSAPSSLILPFSDILLTHNCGSPPPIAGINPHLRPPRHLLSHNVPQLPPKRLSQTNFALFLSLTSLSMPQPSFGLLHQALFYSPTYCLFIAS